MRVLTVNGRVAKDARKETSQSGHTFMTFDIASSEYNDAKDSEGHPIPSWIRVTAFNDRCLKLAEYIKKGKPINVVGDYSDRLYQNSKNGNWTIGRDIIASNIYFELSRIENDGNSGHPQQSAAQPTTAAAPSAAATTAPKSEPKVVAQQADTTDADDDLPF